MLDLYLIMIATPLAAFLHPLLPNVAVVFNVKFMACIALLILVRGGTPRYRYDYLTKLGWIKFLNINLAALSFIVIVSLLL